MIVLAVGAAAACGADSGASQVRPTTTRTAPAAAIERATVAVTTNILADVTRSIAADEVDVFDLMPRGSDPHAFSPSAAEVRRLVSAELIVANGLGLEEGLVDVVGQAADAGVRVLEVAPAMRPIRYAEDAGLDPHVWTDPTRMAIAADLIADELAALVSPDVVPRIDSATSDYVDELSALDGDIESWTADLPIDRRRLVTNHHVLGYFADRYGFEVVGAVLPSGSTLASPSAADLADLAGLIRRTGVPAVFAEISQPDRLVDALATEVGIEIAVADLYSESLGRPGGPAGTYLDMMRHNATTIVDALAPER